MKGIGSVKENLDTEKKIAITPETTKKFFSLGFSINLEKQYAKHLGINDEEYKKQGANINFCLIFKLIYVFTKKFIKYIPYEPGDYCEGVIPDPIPNSEVKSFSADGTLS